MVLKAPVRLSSLLLLLLLDLGASQNSYITYKSYNATRGANLSSQDTDFTFNGFRSANLSMDGTVEVTPEGLLELTNATGQRRGHAFFPAPLHFKASPSGNAVSFSCTFVFGIVYGDSQLNNNSIAFVVSPSDKLSSDGGAARNSTNNLIAVDLATADVLGSSNQRAGIDANSVRSVNSSAAGYYDRGTDEFRNLTLTSGDAMQVWVEYDSRDMRFNVTLSPARVAKPSTPLMSSTVNLSDIVKDEMYVGFSSSTGLLLASHYILGWSFRLNGQARPLNISVLPSLPSPPPLASLPPLASSPQSPPGRPSGPSPPHLPPNPDKHKKGPLALWSSLGSVLLVLAITASVVLILMRKAKPAEQAEGWEVGYGPHQFPYRDLYAATGGFKEKGLLGAGGFGRVYRGVLPSSNIEVAVKRVSPGSKQGMKEFIAEIVSIGRLRHRNLVQLLGYCRRKKELLLVYSYMPNGSLDKLLFDRGGRGLSWDQRFQIIKGVASGLLYLHEEWEKVIIHRDIKAGNVLLDGDFNGRLGDFGLARLYDHGNDPQTTHVAGTMGYMAPELTRTGRATKSTDVFALGVFLLEVACGRRPIERHAREAEVVLLDWVLSNWKNDEITESVDPRLMGEYAVEEMELVLKLGLVCSHPLPAARPTIRQVMQYLLGDFPLPDLSPSYMDVSVVDVLQNEAFEQQTQSSPNAFSTDSLFYGGR